MSEEKNLSNTSFPEENSLETTSELKDPVPTRYF